MRDFEFIDRSLFHVHIPKTGGTTLNSSFDEYDWFVNGGHCFAEANFPVKGVRIEDGCWANYTQKGFEPRMLKIAVIRNPFDWLRSYYSHKGSSFMSLIRHAGWQGCNNVHKFKTFDDFVLGYIDETFQWHVPPLKVSQVGQLIHNGELDACLLIYNEYLDDFIDLVCRVKNIPIRKRKVLNRGEYAKIDYSAGFSVKVIDALLERYEGFFELSGYGVGCFDRKPTIPFIDLKTGLKSVLKKGFF